MARAVLEPITPAPNPASRHIPTTAHAATTNPRLSPSVDIFRSSRGLPPEVLLQVLRDCQSFEKREVEELTNYPQWARYPPWSQVCHSWRTLAQNAPELWCHLHTQQPPEQIREYLRRSMDHPLSIDLNCNDAHYSEHESEQEAVWMEVFRYHVARVLRLVLEADEFLLAHFFPEALTMPMLEQLYLNYGDLDEEEGAVVPTVLCSLTAPKLLQLDLTDYFIPWEAQLLRSAAELRSLSVFSRLTDNPHTSTELVAALRSLPRLEELTLHECVPLVVSGLRDPPSMVHLPALRLLTLLEGGASDCASLLQMLTFPPTCRLQLKVRHDGAVDRAAFRGLAASLKRQILAMDEGTKPLSIRLFFWLPQGFKIEFQHPVTGPFVYINLGRCDIQCITSALIAFRDYIEALPASRLILDSRPHFTMQKILETFCPMHPRLISLELIGHDFPDQSLTAMLASAGLISDAGDARIQELLLGRGWPHVSEEMLSEVRRMVRSVVSE